MNFQAFIDEVDAIQMASDLVKIPSSSLQPPFEKEVATFIFKRLRDENIQVEMVEVLPGRFNVIGTLKGSGGGKSLMLCGHLDTVPAYDMQDPLSGRVKDGILYGRGACDMKGGVAAMLAAFIALKRSAIQLKGDLVFAGVIDEEEMGKGIDYLALHGPFTDAAVIGEPTSLKLALGQKGLEWLKIDIFGKKVHGGRMEEGINAIEMAGRLIERIYRQYTPELTQRDHPMLGRSTINIGRIEGGDQPSTVPGSCSLQIDRRWIPSESLDQVYKELNSLLEELQQEDPKFKAEVKPYFPPGELLPHNPFCTDRDNPLTQSAQSVMQVLGYNTEPTVFPAWTDAGILAACTDTQCLIMGPGDLALAHTPGECVSTADLKKAARFYGALALDYCAMEG